MPASYLALHASGELARRRDLALASLTCCTLCPRACAEDRTHGSGGFCGTGRHAHVASHTLHYGEEAPLVGSGGSGAIFFSGCNLACVFCQNHDISRHASSHPQRTARALAGVMLDLQSQGAHNINLVSPSHVVPQILEALCIAVDRGLILPLVYNTSGYDSPQVLSMLEDVVDIYMPDTKFGDETISQQLSTAPDYVSTARTAIRIMHRQTGDLFLDDAGVALRGLLVRHLVLPHKLAGTRQWMRFLAQEISRDTYVNIMDQYRPCADAHEVEGLDQVITPAAYQTARTIAFEEGLHRLDDRIPAITRMMQQLLGS